MSFKWGKTMLELTKLEQLQKKVADTKAAFDAAYFDAAAAAWVALVKAKLELAKYLKEQDNA